MTLRDVLLHVANGCAAAHQRNFAGDPFAQYVAVQAPQALQRLPGTARWLVKGSAGKGGWSSVPWLAFLDPLVTESTQHGQYVVYLFAPRERKVYLSLNQGTTEMYGAFGESMGLRILADRAEKMRALAATYGAPTDVTQISLGETGRLPRGYERGHAAGYCYDATALPSEAQLRDDLLRLLEAYRQMILDLDFGDDDQPDCLGSPAAPLPAGEAVLERRRYVMHRRIERRRDIAKKVKAQQGHTCRACGLRFTDQYGPLGQDFIEVHHLRPLASLAVDTAVRYDLREDYAVLCANCHRMIHRLEDVSDLEGLQAIIRGARN